MHSHDRRVAIAVALLLALTLLPAAAKTGGEAGDQRSEGRPAASAPAERRSRPAKPDVPRRPGRVRDIDVYRGMATWLDMYDAGPYAHPEDTVRAMARRGVTTVYVQTANYYRPRDRAKRIFRYKVVSRIVEAAHRHDLAVVGWYLPSFADVDHDFRRSRAAINFRTEHGQGFDGFALDIESPVVDNLDVRNRRLAVLAGRIAASVPASYALGAIVPEAGANYWRDFPYQSVAEHFDVFLPMAYHTFRVSGYDGVAHNIRRNIRVIREQTGDPGVPIHVIGGLAGDSRVAEVRAFVDTARSRRVIGASVYDWPTTPLRHWRQLRRLRS